MIDYNIIEDINGEFLMSGILEEGGGFVISSDSKKELLSKGKLALEGLLSVNCMVLAIDTYSAIKNAEMKLEKSNSDLDEFQTTCHEKVCIA